MKFFLRLIFPLIVLVIVFPWVGSWRELETRGFPWLAYDRLGCGIMQG